MNEQALIDKSGEILTDIKEWRRAHPKATFIEIEDEVHKRIMQLEAQVLQDAAQASTSREWGQTKEAPVPLCPKCDTPLQSRGKRERRLQGNGGESVTLHRTYGVCSKCGHGLFPPG